MTSKISRYSPGVSLVTRHPSLVAGDAWFRSRGWTPFPLQQEAWRAFLDGRDGLVHASTGTGKTFAAAIGPMLDEGSFLIPQLEGTPYVSTPYEKMVIATGYVDVNEPATAADLLILAENEARSQGQQVTQKLDAARFKALTGWAAPSNQHQRDAAVVAWRYRNGWRA